MLQANKLLFKGLLALVCFNVSLLVVSGQATGTQCTPVDGAPSCVCDHPDGRIDLTQFSNSDGTPKYTNLIDPNMYPYEFNPCKTFTQGCSDAFICQQDKFDSSTYYKIGAAGTEKIYLDKDDNNNDVVYLYYTEPDSGRFARMYLDCDLALTGEPEFTTYGDSQGTILHYVFHMKHSGVCPNAAPSGGGSVAGEAGIAIIFILLGILAAYFIVGAIVMKFKFQATGTDIIPQKAFWFSLPFLVKDGFLFTFNPCVSAIKNRGYSKT